MSASPAALPSEAYTIALLSLPDLGHARLSALLRLRDPATLWNQIAAGRLDEMVRVALRPAGRPLLDAWKSAAEAIDPASLLAPYRAQDIDLLVLGSPAYPSRLRDDPEASAVLFARGDARSLDAPTVAIVGTRRCTTSGAGIAYELGRDLTNSGVCIVSGLALGIDGAAHRGALAATGPAPIAVVGSGLDVIYPRQNAALWHDVERAGAVLSEAPLGARPERWRFPDRNRIIAGLADVVVVVESRHAGGSMHTVDEADKRGIDVMAVPGSIRSAAAGGTNDLLAEGRAPVRDADDVLMAIGLTTRVEPGGRDDRPPATDVAAVVLDAFEWQPVTGDHLTLRTGLPVPTVALALAQLEADGWVVASGGWYERVASTR